MEQPELDWYKSENSLCRKTRISQNIDSVESTQVHLEQHSLSPQIERVMKNLSYPYCHSKEESILENPHKHPLVRPSKERDHELFQQVKRQKILQDKNSEETRVKGEITEYSNGPNLQKKKEEKKDSRLCTKGVLVGEQEPHVVPIDGVRVCRTCRQVL